MSDHENYHRSFPAVVKSGSGEWELKERRGELALIADGPPRGIAASLIGRDELIALAKAILFRFQDELSEHTKCSLLHDQPCYCMRDD